MENAKEIERKLTKTAAKTLGLRQKDVNIDHYGYGKFSLHIGHYGRYVFVMRDGSKKKEIEFTFNPDKNEIDIEILNDIQKIKINN